MIARRSAALALRVFVLLSAGVALAGCAEPRPAVTAQRRPLEPSWEALFSPMPELCIVLRPRAIARDPVYGTFFKNLLRLARAESRIGGDIALRATEEAEEIVVGLGGAHADPRSDAVAVLRGVPADLDPERITDARGEPLLRRLDGPSVAREYDVVRSVDTDPASDDVSASVFVLPERTWVVALGRARMRARQLFASPRRARRPELEPDALAVLRIDAATFVRRRRLDESATFGPLVKKIVDGTVALDPAKAGARIVLRYEDDAASAAAEQSAKAWISELTKPAPSGEADARGFQWLQGARISRARQSMIVRFDLPARLLDELPHASGAELAP